jgi:hypothetical protein
MITANVTVVAATLYAWSFVNFTDVVARYNVAHGRDTTAGNRSVDLTYLFSLGPQAIPAIDRYLADRPLSLPERLHAPPRRTQLANEHLAATGNWRAWTFRDWRLSRYLEASPHAPRLTPP